VVSGSSPPLLWSFPPTTAFTSFPAPDCWALLLLLPAGCLFTADVGGGSYPLSCGVFLPLPLFTSFSAPGCWAHAPSLLYPEPLWPGPVCLFTVPGRILLPTCSALSVPHPLCNVSLLLLLLITQFLFFPPVDVGLSRGYAVLAQGCLWEYRVPLGSPCPLFTSGLGTGNWWPRGPPGFSV
jgi:hypothetical protein